MLVERRPSWSRIILALCAVGAVVMLAPQVAVAQRRASRPAVTKARRPSAVIAVVIAAAAADSKAGKFAEAVAALTAAGRSALTARDKKSIDFALADAELAWGVSLTRASDYDGAKQHIHNALAIDTHYPDRLAATGVDQRRLGNVADELSHKDDALALYQKSLKIAQQSRDRSGEAKALLTLGSFYSSLRQNAQAVQFFNRALPIFRKLGDRLDEAGTLMDTGLVFSNTSEYRQAIAMYLRSLSVFRDLHDDDAQEVTLDNLGNAYNNLGEYDRAISYFGQAVTIASQSKNPRSEASALADLGNVYFQTGRFDKAIDFYEKALVIQKRTQDIRNEANTISNLGAAYSGLSKYELAVQFYEQALMIDREIGNSNSEALALQGLGTAWLSLNKYAQAIDALDKSREILHQLGNRDAEAGALDELGRAYTELSQYNKAIAYYEKALSIHHTVGNIQDEAGVLMNLGTVYDILAQPKAIDFYGRALAIFRRLKARGAEASALSNLGSANDTNRQYQKAIGFYEQALPILRETGDRVNEANTLMSEGAAYANLRRFDEAIRLYEAALPIYLQIKERDGEATASANLSRAWSDTANPRRDVNLAILFGKQAVNAVQSIRGDIHGLDARIDQDYTKSKARDYRSLADLLIAQGRLPEAQQVLGLLKEHELLEFVRGDSAPESTLKTAELNSLEKEADQRIQAQGDAVASLTSTYDALIAKRVRTSEDQKQLDSLRPRLQAARVSFDHVLQSLNTLFAAHSNAVSQQDVDIKDSPALARTLHTLQKDTQRTPVAVYTLVGDHTLRFLIYAADGVPVAREYPIGAEELRRKVYALRDMLQNPVADPRPLAKRLYDILLGPIAHDLDGMNATEVMWSLDDALRYLPIDALSPDGTHYLVENLGRRHSIFTPATLNASVLTSVPSRAWTALALGVSLPHTVKTDSGEDTFRALPGVPAELSGIVRGTDGGAAGGVLPGTVLLDDKFTRASLERTLEDGHGQFPVVHIASHFNFHPGGDDGSSYLLLGDGTPLSLADIRGLSATLFADVDLLTLSACDTATGGNGSDPGAEVESFGALAQREGAASVLATLWPVADASTPVLMHEFYAIRAAHPELPKTEALRQAQITLLTGSAKPPANSTAAAAPKRSELLAAPPVASSKDAPVFTPDPAKPWAHPYYWAPFILIGNWK